MGISRFAGILYAVVSAGVVAFQIAMALGAPWGAYAMGGVFPGRFPMAMRIAALVQASIILLWILVVLSRTGLAFPGLSRPSRKLVWLAVAFATIGLLLNLVTPSAGERIIWAPVAFVLLICSVLAATSPSGKPDNLPKTENE
ncbi:MAG: hypothetical protein HGB00_09495 [Chlorobiaceae bacterium]|nr:hypothetical protein [Chlorobiaceae bacterium]